MKSGPTRSAHALDDTEFRYDLSHAIYGSFPSCASHTTPPRRSRAPSPHFASKASSEPASSTLVDSTLSGQNEIQSPDDGDGDIDSDITNNSAIQPWLSHQPNPPSHADNMDNMHQSVCLNLTPPCETTTSESELWILPELDDCNAHPAASSTSSSSTSSSSSPSSSPKTSPRPSIPLMVSGEKQISLFLSHATKAKSQFEQLRTRLLQGDYDGWDLFVARCSPESKDRPRNKNYHGEERVDEEFDLVVLSTVRASC
ncbi:hypothetical protein COCMIDRAFT_107157 [Bipolaris oryzae ATCC 44560]|uniref:Uncharacterized protein n=1 Tax=Bipolaris oryzae ATCC 44560 TaxID=930090 RepID=W6YNU5_COCMI|nr:uncharacterized protein COCMIDRAFT_107157 [Bipolaris oryzae ATCC 44560]EUC41057.1 hypothetical protein COCMIDRAFT_107157 [Bipolaris oryzae ATCC 44560]